MTNKTLTSIAGLSVGHWTHQEAATGCTVVLCPPEGCVASGSVLGGAPGSRETALLAPEKTVQRVHAVVLAGGSAFGLDAASGVMRWLAEQGRGFETPFARVPIVPAAVIYDLSTGRADVRPDAAAGYAAAQGATAAPVASGRVGVGMGATVGKYVGFDHAARSGLGSSVIAVGGATIAALAVSNAVGDIVDPDTGRRVAGSSAATSFLEVAGTGLDGTNTTLVVVATDAALTKAQAYALSHSAHVGIARVTRPSHTPSDGDTAFVLSTATGTEVPLFTLAVAVQEVVAAAILNGVRAAQD
ncbi:P1 family peptidase [soil metagenome]